MSDDNENALRVGFPKPRSLPPCLVGAHKEACDNLCAEVAKNTGMEVAECGCPCHGRDVASDPLAQALAEVQRLTAELALKDQALKDITALHTEFRIYSECDCGHSDEAVLAGDAVDTGYFIACEETFEYAICAACCTADDEQTSDCASYHDHRKNEPICATVRILTRLDTQGETK